MRDVQLLCFGAATILDTIVLLMLLERRNRPRTPLPLVGLILGAWLFHAGSLVHTLLAVTPGGMVDTLHLAAMVVLSTGLLLLPSAMLHGVSRLRRSGLEPRPRVRRSYGWFYVPVLAVVPVAFLLGKNPRSPFLDLTAPAVLPYLLWLSAVNLYAAISFYSLSRSADSGLGRFYRIVSYVLLAMIGFHSLVFAVVRPLFPDFESFSVLAMVLSPVPLTLLLAYSVVRLNFLKLVFERSLAYGGLILLLFLLHRVLFRDLRDALTDTLKFDIVLLEILFVVAMVLAVQPLRRRTAEALRYFMGEPVAEQRDRVRRLAIEMSALSGQPLGEILDWFDVAVRRSFGVEFARVWILAPEGEVLPPSKLGLNDVELQTLARDCEGTGETHWWPWSAPSQETASLFERMRISLFLSMSQTELKGFVAIGSRQGNRGLTEEQCNMVILLVEQLGVTLNNSLLQADRLVAERRALQNDKLSTLGLVASSIAHEVKNPLSSIKTIVSLLAEDLPPGAEGARELEIVRGEVDRLSTTVSRLLGFARPSEGESREGSASEVLRETLLVLQHLAKKQSLDLREDVPKTRIGEDRVRDREALKEIFFNLIKNGIEAAGPRGKVTVEFRCSGNQIEVEIGDDGPGLAPEIQDRLFEPFLSTKEKGSGLGLYVVSRRLRDIGGGIECVTEPGRGTLFKVRVPRWAPEGDREPPAEDPAEVISGGE